MSKCLDLALLSARKRQSEITGFIHLFHGKDSQDAIPLYENFCFALALLRQKTQESMQEAKELITKLIAFQDAEGNFPIHLHEYPRTYFPYQGLKIAPILAYALRDFGACLGEELKEKMEMSLKKILLKEVEKPLWVIRKRALLGQTLLALDTSAFSPEEWAEWICTNQLVGLTHF